MNIQRTTKAAIFLLRRFFELVSPPLGTNLSVRFFRNHGMIINGHPNYISGSAWFDGSDYSLIEINDGCTISTEVILLTHDWSLTTVGRGIGHEISPKDPVGILRNIKVGHHAFIGMRSMLLPGCEIGECSIIGAGTVVRGKIPPFSVVIGNPGQVVGDSRTYYDKNVKAKCS